MKYLYGPIPSRRLGRSLGIGTIPTKTCNYACVYCQLGKTKPMTNTRQWFYPLEAILEEFEQVLASHTEFDVVSIVGEGEPTLYLGLGQLIDELKKRTNKPVAVITNGALLYDPAVRQELCKADIVLPTVDAWDEASLRQINRPHRSIHFPMILEGLLAFCKEYKGQLWLEVMLMAGVNDDVASLTQYANLLKQLKYDRLYINTPVRPPAEAYASAISHEAMELAVEILGGISIELMTSLEYHSDIKDDYEAIISLIRRHPMNQHELDLFLTSRKAAHMTKLLDRLMHDPMVEVITYKGYTTYRLKY